MREDPCFFICLKFLNKKKKPKIIFKNAIYKFQFKLFLIRDFYYVKNIIDQLKLHNCLISLQTHNYKRIKLSKSKMF